MPDPRATFRGNPKGRATVAREGEVKPRYPENRRTPAPPSRKVEVRESVSREHRTHPPPQGQAQDFQKRERRRHAEGRLRKHNVFSERAAASRHETSPARRADPAHDRRVRSAPRGHNEKRKKKSFAYHPRTNFAARPEKRPCRKQQSEYPKVSHKTS
ncbi:hypothetical protein N2W54_003080 [Lotmaria passim]